MLRCKRMRTKITNPPVGVLRKLSAITRDQLRHAAALRQRSARYGPSRQSRWHGARKLGASIGEDSTMAARRSGEVSGSDEDSRESICTQA